MKKTQNLVMVTIFIIMISCQPAADTSANDEARALFVKNAQTVQNYLNAWQNESVNHADYYADDFSAIPTTFGVTDTVTLEMMIEGDKNNWAAFDFEMVDPPFNFLPGVNVDSKEMDGSVRYYGQWRVTRTATDSTEERSGEISIYSAFVFNDEGKIQLQLTFGDFGNLMDHLMDRN